MTTTQRNAATLALLAPLACPTIDLLCALYVALCTLHARTIGRVIEARAADRAARRALASYRAAMLNPVRLPFTASPYPLLGAADVVTRPNYPVLGDDDLTVEPALSRRLAEITGPPTCADDVVVTVAACSPVEPAPEQSQWVPTGDDDGWLGFTPRVLVTALTYRELQALAKAHGVRANQSKAALIAALKSELTP